MGKARLFKLDRPEGDTIGYPEYLAAVVVATSEDDARLIHPESGWQWQGEKWANEKRQGKDNLIYWPSPNALVVTLLGEAVDNLLPGTVVLFSYTDG